MALRKGSQHRPPGDLENQRKWPAISIHKHIIIARGFIRFARAMPNPEIFLLLVILFWLAYKVMTFIMISLYRYHAFFLIYLHSPLPSSMSPSPTGPLYSLQFPLVSHIYVLFPLYFSLNLRYLSPCSQSLFCFCSLQMHTYMKKHTEKCRFFIWLILLSMISSCINFPTNITTLIFLMTP